MFVCVLAGSGGMRWQGGDKMCGCSFEAFYLKAKLSKQASCHV